MGESTESMEQQGFVTWFREKYPGVLIFSVPNGNWRGISVGRRLKAEGLTPGVPDLFIPSWKLFLEFKRKTGGVVSKDQEKIIGYLQRVGYTVFICRGAEDGAIQVMDFRKGLE